MSAFPISAGRAGSDAKTLTRTSSDLSLAGEVTATESDPDCPSPEGDENGVGEDYGSANTDTDELGITGVTISGTNAPNDADCGAP